MPISVLVQRQMLMLVGTNARANAGADGIGLLDDQ